MKKVITLLFLNCFIAANAQWSNKIVFSVPANTPAEDSVLTIDPDGSNLTFITNGYSPRLNHHSNRLAYLNGSNNDRTLNDIYFKDGSGAPYLFYTNGGYAIYNFDFSPQDSYFQLDWQGNFYRMDAEQPNGASTNIGSGAGDFNDAYPRLSTVDSQVVFHNKNNGLYLMPFAGQVNTNLIANTVAGDMYPYWSPDGQWIYFMKQYPGVEGKMHNIYKIHPNGSGLTQVTSLKTTDTLGATLVITKNGKWAVAPARIKGVTGIYKFRIDQPTPDTLGYLIRSFNYLSSPCGTLWVGSADSVNNDISMAITEPVALQASIYPNPATDNVQIQVEKTEAVVLVQVFSALGESVIEEQRPNTGNIAVSLAGIPAGIYLLKASSGGKVYNTRLVKD